ncbi:MAG: hypothetical protein NT067_01065 [Candidatus Diapherotrites archaeon]|nr:hypothetical protein [Candidatus Diapherotrites archaeon]
MMLLLRRFALMRLLALFLLCFYDTVVAPRFPVRPFGLAAFSFGAKMLTATLAQCATKAKKFQGKEKDCVSSGRAVLKGLRNL